VVSTASGAAAGTRRALFGASAGTRRALLGASGAAAAAVLAGCGSSSQQFKVHEIPLAVRAADIEILNRLLEIEFRAITAYTAGIPLVRGPIQDAAKLFLTQEISHAGELSGLIRKAGTKANKQKADYDIGLRPRTPADVLALWHAWERAQIAAYLQELPNLEPGPVRAAIASILANDAQHVAVLRSAQGLDPLAVAFVSGSD
jgi:hypothetical protein